VSDKPTEAEDRETFWTRVADMDWLRIAIVVAAILGLEVVAIGTFTGGRKPAHSLGDQISDYVREQLGWRHSSYARFRKAYEKPARLHPR
jgi:hypothetical protein